jgi:spore coat protein U-like protein
VRRYLISILGFFCLLSWQHAHAQTCTVSSSAAAFGTYAPAPGAGTAVSTTATVTVVCNPWVITLTESYTIALSIGGGSSYALRSMGGPTPRLRYQLYRDNAATQIWGDGSAGTYTVSDSYTLGVIFPITRTYTAYGVIAANTLAAVGMYTDTIMITLTY